MVPKGYKILSGKMLPVIAGLLALTFAGLGGCASTHSEPSYYAEEVTDDYEYLSYYGQWVYLPAFGSVWCPDVVYGWQPYYYGHWIWTGDYWAWTSYEPYGWLVYHYGFWGFTPDIGWFWVPGDVWYPARVDWIVFDDYIGWAPLPPPGIIWPQPWDLVDIDIWIIVENGDFIRDDIGTYRVDRPVYRDIAGSRTIEKRAPSVREIEGVMREEVPVVRIGEEPAKVRHRRPPERQASEQRTETKLKKMVLPTTEERKVMIDRASPLPITRQCRLLDVSRSSVYYTAVPVSDLDLELMRRIDEIYLKRPFYGSRRIRDPGGSLGVQR